MKTLSLLFILVIVSPSSKASYLGHCKKALQTYFAKNPESKYKLSRLSSKSIRRDITPPIRQEYVSTDEVAEFKISYNSETQSWFFLNSGEDLPSGRFIFVMDHLGQIYVDPLGKMHSAYLRTPLTSAGHLVFEKNYKGQSKLISMSDRTGHYQLGFPDSHTNWRQFMNSISKFEGLNLSDIKIKKENGEEFFAVDKYFSKD